MIVRVLVFLVFGLIIVLVIVLGHVLVRVIFRVRLRLRDRLRVRVADSAASCLDNRLGSKLPRIKLKELANQTRHSTKYYLLSLVMTTYDLFLLMITCYD